MASCSTLSASATSAAYDKVASYYIYHAYCNAYNKCDGAIRQPYACNTAVNRTKVISTILKPKMAANATLRAQVSNLICNIQLKGNAVTIESQAKSIAKNLIHLMGVSYCQPHISFPADEDPPHTPNTTDPIMSLLGNKNIQIMLLLGGGLLVAVMLLGKKL